MMRHWRYLRCAAGRSTAPSAQLTALPGCSAPQEKTISRPSRRAQGRLRSQAVRGVRCRVCRVCRAYSPPARPSTGRVLLGKPRCCILLDIASTGAGRGSQSPKSQNSMRNPMCTPHTHTHTHTHTQTHTQPAHSLHARDRTRAHQSMTSLSFHIQAQEHMRADTQAQRARAHMHTVTSLHMPQTHCTLPPRTHTL
jgi:hypothetical protein